MTKQFSFRRLKKTGAAAGSLLLAFSGAASAHSWNSDPFEATKNAARNLCNHISTDRTMHFEDGETTIDLTCRVIFNTQSSGTWFAPTVGKYRQSRLERSAQRICHSSNQPLQWTYSEMKFDVAVNCTPSNIQTFKL